MADSDSSWWIATRVGLKPVQVVPSVDRTLKALSDAEPGGWRSSGERSCFELSPPGPENLFRAGWYELSGRLQALDGTAITPCFYVAYAAGADGDWQIPLPEPDAQGRVRALLLFKYDVVGLRFCPALSPIAFRMRGFQLRPVSRVKALARMLGPATSNEDAGASSRIGRGLRFLASVVRTNLSAATTELFNDYNRRLLPRGSDDYETWTSRYDILTTQRMEALHERGRELEPAGPLISILLPVYQTPEVWLRRCIESVLAQTYPKWQLCVSDDASPDARLKEVLTEYAERDSRISVVRRPVNGHISAASNSALALARGEYVALLDHDDELRPHALLEMVEAILCTPDAGLLYSDEDKIDAVGRRFDPYFKPDFDPDLLRSQNYICHFTAIRTDLVRAVGGFAEGYEGSQDHDLILKCTERLQAAQIRHIPKILYHWRAIPGSTALTRDAKDYASSAGVRAVADHLDRLETGAQAEELAHGHYRVRWPLPSPRPKVSLVIPTRNKVELLRMCVDSILSRTQYPQYEVVVVDNGSDDPEALAYLARIGQHDRVRVLRYDVPFNYSRINNWAIRQTTGELVGLINNDIEVIAPDWLDEMASHALRPDIGAVGAMLYYPDDTIQHAGVILGVHGVAAHVYAKAPRGCPGHGGRIRVAQGLSAVTGACLLVRRKLFEQVGGLDEQLEVAFNDIDFCLRLREAGYRNLWTPFAELYHHESASRGSDASPEKAERFQREVRRMEDRWRDLLRDDPAYNPNLSLNHLNFELAFPPRGR